MGYSFIPNKRVVSHGPKLQLDNYYDKDYHKIEHEYSFEYGFQFADRSEFQLSYKNMYVELQGDFNPTSDEMNYLPGGSVV